MRLHEQRPVCARVVGGEHLAHLGMPQRLSGFVRQQVLFRDIGDVFGLIVLGQQMVKWLILARTQFDRDGQPPFFGVVELRFCRLVVGNVFPIFSLSEAQGTNKAVLPLPAEIAF